MPEPDIEISNDDTSIKLFDHDDEGHVKREVVITSNGQEFVVVDSEGVDHLEVYERVPGETRPFKKWAPVEKRLPQE